MSSPVFIGRRPELDRLETALAGVMRREPQLLLVAGDAGVGKTRLAAEFVGHARASGCEVLSGGCLSVGEADLPFAALVEALRGVVRTHGRADFEALAGPGRAELGRLVPDLGSAGAAAVNEPPTAGGWAQARLFELLLGFLGRLAARSPVVLLVEDLHWADEATRGLVAYLARNLADERVLLVATVRTDDLHRRHPLLPLLAELARSTRVERIDLAPFDHVELAEQLAGILGRQPEPALVTEIMERSEGNAYLAEELAAIGPSGRLPGTISEVLLARVGRLEPAAQDALRVASAAGPRLDAGLLTQVASGIMGDPLPAIRELVEAHVLVPSGDDAPVERYAFRHALIQEAVYGELLPAERVRYHEAFAYALAARPGPPDPVTAAELAHHWEGAHDLPRALEASVEAGHAAIGIYAFADAQHLFERALALWNRVPDAEARAGMDRPGLLELAGATADAAGADIRAVAHLRSAIEIVNETEDPVRAGLLRERLGRYALGANEPVEMLAATRDAVRLVPSHPPTAARARALGGLARSLFYMDLVDEAAVTAREAITIASATGARDVEADALTTLSRVLCELGAVGDAMSNVRRARDIGLEIGDDYVVVRAWGNMLVALDRAADEEGCATEAAAAVTWAEARGRTTSAALVVEMALSAAYQLGRSDEGARMLRMVPAEIFEGPNASGMRAVAAELGIVRGDLDTAGRMLDGAREFVRPGIEWAGDRVAIADVAARLALTRRDLREGRMLVQPGLAELPGLTTGRRNLFCYILLTALRIESELAEHARLRGAEADLAEAAAHGSTIIEEARSVITPFVTVYPELRRRPAAVLALCEAEWSRLQGTSNAGLWAAAVAACEEAQQLHLRPYALYRQAEALLAAKAERAEAAALLRDAHAAVVAMGARPLQQDIEALAERARIRLEPAPSSSSGPVAPAAERIGLTPRELEVLALVAAGRTNRQIAGELFISEKTAGVHVSNILRKLGASGRTEAAAIARRLGIVG